MRSKDTVYEVIPNEFEEPKLKLAEKAALVCGNSPSIFHYQMIQVYLLFFYTDFMKINPGFVAVLFLVVRVINALCAPLFGALMDKVKFPIGKYTPWFLLLGVPLGITGWLTFTNFHLSSPANLIYVVGTYVLYSICSAIISIPGSAVLPMVTKRVDDRVSVGQFAFLFVLLGAIIVQVGAVPLYKALGSGNDEKGFSVLMAIAGLITILIAIVQSTKIKERYVIQVKNDEKMPSFKQMIFSTFTNKAAIIVYIFMFSNAISAGVRSATAIYFYKYFFNNEGIMALMGFIQLFPSILGTVLSQKVVKRMGLKGTVIIAVISNVVGCVALVLVPSSSTGLYIFIAVNVITTFISAFSTPAQGTMLPAAIDYTEWKTGLNLNGFMSSMNGFIQTFATALSGAIVAGSLAVIGYVPDVVQSSSTIFGFKVLLCVVPALLLVLQFSIIWYDLTEDKQALIAKELSERRMRATKMNE